MLVAVETRDWKREAGSDIIQDGQDGSGTTLYGPQDHSVKVTKTVFVSRSQDHIVKVTKTILVSHYD